MISWMMAFALAEPARVVELLSPDTTQVVLHVDAAGAVVPELTGGPLVDLACAEEIRARGLVGRFTCVIGSLRSVPVRPDGVEGLASSENVVIGLPTAEAPVPRSVGALSAVRVSVDRKGATNALDPSPNAGDCASRAAVARARVEGSDAGLSPRHVWVYRCLYAESAEGPVSIGSPLLIATRAGADPDLVANGTQLESPVTATRAAKGTRVSPSWPGLLYGSAIQEAACDVQVRVGADGRIGQVLTRRCPAIFAPWVVSALQRWTLAPAPTPTLGGFQINFKAGGG
jgi:hypothetical protein